MAQQPDSDFELEWFLLQGASAMGAKGTTGGVINVLECGGATGGNLDAAGSYIHPYTDQQLGTGRVMVGEVERHRWLSAAWAACSVDTRNLLALRHQAPPAAFRSDAGYGATDRWVEGSDHREGALGLTRTGIDTHLGVMAGLAVRLAPDPARLLIACHDPEPLHRTGKRAGTVNREEADRRRRVMREARERAEAAMVPAWAEWFAAKEAAAPVRRTSERRAILPAYVGGEAAE